MHPCFLFLDLPISTLVTVFLCVHIDPLFLPSFCGVYESYQLTLVLLWLGVASKSVAISLQMMQFLDEPSPLSSLVDYPSLEGQYTHQVACLYSFY